MMIESSSKGEEGNQQDGDDNNIKIDKLLKAPLTSSSRQWSAFRNPRIVRVSRSLGGKDRHSKVCTIRGLRDRRIRLSVPTAIQLYDLQDRLGLTQPSKVVDWLLENTKSDIDKLPPLQIPHCFSQFHHQQTLLPGTSQFSLGGYYDANSTFMKDVGNQNLMAPKSRYNWGVDSLNGKELGESTSQKGKCWIKTNEQENHHQDDGIGIGGSHSREDYSSSSSYSAQKLFGLLNNGMTHYSEPSSLSLSHFGNHGFFPSSHSSNYSNSGSGVQFSSSSSYFSAAAASGPQLLFCLPSATPSSAFYSVESDPRQSNILSSSSHVMMPHPLIQSFRSTNSPPRRYLPTSLSSKFLDSGNNNNDHSHDKGSARS